MRWCRLPVTLALAAGLGAQGAGPRPTPIEVRGLDEDGRPLDGAAVTVAGVETLLTDEGSARPSTRSGADGRFELTDRVAIKAAHHRELEQRRDHVWVLGITGHGSPGLDLGEGRREHTFLVPVGDVELEVHPGASRLHMGGTHWTFERSLGKVAFEAEEGEALRITLEVDPPASIDK